MKESVFTVYQITDPHLGLFMTPQDLRMICEEAVATGTYPKKKFSGALGSLTFFI